MKKLLAFFALAAGATACQQGQTTLPAAQAAPRTHKPAAPGQPVVLTAKARTLLSRYDLSELLRLSEEEYSRPENGFFGPDHYRLEMAFTSVTRDPAQPNVYHVAGKSRYKKFITPFTGTITLAGVTDQPAYTAKEIAEAKKSYENYQPGDISKYDPPYMYTASGQFELREDPTARGAGVFRGRFALDWAVADDGKLMTRTRSERSSLTQGGLVKYQGTWTNAKTRQTYAVEWVRDLEAYRPAQVLEVFELGGRDVNISPKYAKRGWNTYWENDEWWHDAPRLTTAL